MSGRRFPCVKPGDNHSNDIVHVYTGHVAPIPMCGYHYAQSAVTA